jgi:hypothetical protein
MERAESPACHLSRGSDFMNEQFDNIPFDDRFTVKVSANMEVRNVLRSGLVDAQGHEPEKIPLFVSWPEWLDDGIVCLYARDLHELLRSAVRDTAGQLAPFIERDVPDGAG